MRSVARTSRLRASGRSDSVIRMNVTHMRICRPISSTFQSRSFSSVNALRLRDRHRYRPSGAIAVPGPKKYRRHIGARLQEVGKLELPKFLKPGTVKRPVPRHVIVSPKWDGYRSPGGSRVGRPLGPSATTAISRRRMGATLSVLCIVKFSSPNNAMKNGCLEWVPGSYIR